MDEGQRLYSNGEDFELDGDALDAMTRADLAEVDPTAAAVAGVLDDWLTRHHGIVPGRHNAGAFLDLLAAEGYRVHPIDPGPPFEQLLPASPD